jgi:hypothetical protein
MRRRLIEGLAVAGVIVALVVLLQLSRRDGPGGGRAGAGATTRWGDPDLQGLWTNEYEIPLQRPAALAGKEFLSDDELAERASRAAAVPTFSARTAERGTEQDVAGAYDVGFQADRKPIGRRTSLIVDPPDGRIPPATPALQQARRELREYQLALMQAVETCKTTQSRACDGVTPGPPSSRRDEPPPLYLSAGRTGLINRADNPEDFGLGERCLRGQPPSLGGVQRIVQSPGVVAMLYEGWHRVIRVTTDPHLPAHVTQWRGDARGRWEGRTLVVDTTNFNAKTDFQGARAHLHLVERFTRLDADTLEYTATMEDPTSWTRPWTVTIELARQDERANMIYDEPRCHDGNTSMTSMLLGARMDERAFAAGQGPHPATKCYVICGFGNPELEQSEVAER